MPFNHTLGKQKVEKFFTYHKTVKVSIISGLNDSDDHDDSQVHNDGLIKNLNFKRVISKSIKKNL